MDFILFMLDQVRGAIQRTTQNQAQIVSMVKYNEFSQMTLATHTHLAHPLMTIIDFNLFMLDEGRGSE